MHLRHEHLEPWVLDPKDITDSLYVGSLDRLVGSERANDRARKFIFVILVSLLMIWLLLDLLSLSFDDEIGSQGSQGEFIRA